MNARERHLAEARFFLLVYELVHKALPPWDIEEEELVANLLRTIEDLEKPGAEVEAEVALYWGLEYDEDPELAPYWEELVEVARCLTV